MHSKQLEYKLKGKTNDQLRQDWMREVVPFMTELGVRVPAHHDRDTDTYVIDCPFPSRFYPDSRTWDLDAGPVGWPEVLERWKARGEMNEAYVATLQRGYQALQAAAA
jgi:ring-1,2-phenylacetyl-CoA epoxidase subunit PaaA